VLLHEHKPATEQIMRRAGYQLIDYGQDTFGYRQEDRRIERRWQLSLLERLGVSG
jgi:hypothetical protein